MDQGESSNQRRKLTRSSQVAWGGPNSKKRKTNKVKERRMVQSSAGDGDGHAGSDEESYVEGSYSVEECPQKISYERKRRSISQGDYSTKPPKNAMPTLNLLPTGKGFLQSKPKKTLRHIVRTKWDQHTVYTKGAKREAFLDDCINNFKEYYKYPENCTLEYGDRAVRAHLKRNWKHYLNKEKSRLMEHVNELLDKGYTADDIKIKELKPHYYSQSAWNSLCDYWGTPQFKMRSELGKAARMRVEFTPRTGAKPFDQRRYEINVEREAKGEGPIPEDEFLSIVYDPNEPVVKNIQEKMKMLRSSQAKSTPELSPTDQPPSPRTQKEIQQKKELEILIQAKPSSKGIVFLHPHETLPELVGAKEATQWMNKEKERKLNSQAPPAPDEICLKMSNLLEDVTQMVRSLPMREVKQSVLDENVQNLAAAAFSDPSQYALQTHYAGAARRLLPLVLKENDKIVTKESLPEKAMLVNGRKVMVVDGTDDVEDEDPLAHLYPLA